MYTNVNLAAPIGALLLLGAGVLLGAGLLLVIYSLVVRRFGRARLLAAFTVLVASIYLGLILIFSFASSDVALARGSEKHFCELDCHLAYSVVDIQQARTLGTGAHTATAAGMFTVLTIRTRFDETTIGPNRGNGLLYPNSRELRIIDSNGNRYSPSSQAQSALESDGSAGTPLQMPLRPGESYLTRVAFDLPTDASNATLLLHEGDWITRLIIGHENSFFHKHTRFQL